MTKITVLEPYVDDRANEIRYDGHLDGDIEILFRGSGNTLVVAKDAKLKKFHVTFDCSNGHFEIGGNDGKITGFGGSFRVGQDARIVIGRNVSATNPCHISAVEGCTVTIGDDVMFASGNEIRADDGHPIFDVKTGLRVNPARPITIGNHVWVGGRVVLLAGASIGAGSVLGWGSVVKGRIPNNVIAVGVPAKVVRKNIAWERPHLSLVKPYYKPDASTIKKSAYWHLTADPDQQVNPVRLLLGRARRFAGRVRRRLLKRN